MHGRVGCGLEKYYDIQIAKKQAQKQKKLWIHNWSVIKQNCVKVKKILTTPFLLNRTEHTRQTYILAKDAAIDIARDMLTNTNISPIYIESYSKTYN